MKRILCLFLVFGLCLTGCVSNDKHNPVEGKKVAYILNMPTSDIFNVCSDQCKIISEKLGMECQVYFSEGDDYKFKSYVEDCAKNNYDGLYLSHGGSDYSYDLITKILKEHKDLKIVTFDTEFKDSKGETKKIEGVTQLFQDDRDLAKKSLTYITNDLVKDKEPVNILKIWVGPNYISAFDRRDEGYRELEEEGKIKTVATIGPKDYNDAENSVYEVVKETFKKYKKEDIDAIWVAYDAYARGCYKALKELNLDIPMVSIDLSNSDIKNMLSENSMWKATACTDFKSNGEQGIRILALELNDEYDKIIAPGEEKQTDLIEMPASLISREFLKDDTTIENIYNIAPDTYGYKEDFVTSKWLKECIGY